MKYRFISVALTAAVLLLGTSLSSAADTKADAPQQAASKAIASQKNAKAAANIKLVDINSAKKEELKKLPGISDAEAAKIIAGRPYGSKAWLVSHKIISEPTYLAIKPMIIAKQKNTVKPKK